MTVLGDGLVAVGRVGTVADAPVAWISTDGETWRIELMGADGEATAVATMDGGVVAVGNLPGERNVGAEVAWTSADGILWAQSGPFGDGTLRLLGADGNGGLVIAGGICAADQCPAPLWRGDALE